jgi:hypothetical protein
MLSAGDISTQYFSKKSLGWQMAGTSLTELTEEDAANQNSCNESSLGESNMTPECQSLGQHHHLESGMDG